MVGSTKTTRQARLSCCPGSDPPIRFKRSAFLFSARARVLSTILFSYSRLQSKRREAIAGRPRGEFDEAIRLQGDTVATGSMIVNELDAIGELLVGVAQQFRQDGPRGPAVLQGGFELIPSGYVDADGEHVGMQEPPLPILLPGHLDPTHHNRVLEAGAAPSC